MISIKFYFKDVNSLSLKDVNGSGFDYDYFPGSIFIQANDKSIFIDWGWIPLLDFSACLLGICEHLSINIKATEEFEFTESEDKITLIKDHDHLEMAFSFSEEILTFNFTEFYNLVKDTYRNIMHDIINNNIGIKNNTHFSRFLGYLDAIG